MPNIWTLHIEHVEVVKFLNVGLHVISNKISIIRLWVKKLGHLNFRGLHFPENKF
jgi:hypothetical protein